MKSPELFTFLFGLIIGVTLLGLKYDLQEEWNKEKIIQEKPQDNKEKLCEKDHTLK